MIYGNAEMSLVERVARAISREEIWSEENLQRYGDLWIISAREEAMPAGAGGVDRARPLAV